MNQQFVDFQKQKKIRQRYDIGRSQPKIYQSVEFNILNVYKPNHIQEILTKSLEGHIESRNSIATGQNLNNEQYLNISLIPILLSQIKQMMSTYLQLQVIIDPETGQFFKTSGGKQYWAIVNSILNTKSIIQCWHLSYLYWSDQQQKLQWWNQIINFIKNTYKHYRCLVDIDIFYTALSNQIYMVPVLEENIQQIQNQAFKFRNSKIKKLYYTNSFTFMMQSFSRAISEKRSSYKLNQTSFFLISQAAPSYQSLILQNLTKQVEKNAMISNNIKNDQSLNDQKKKIKRRIKRIIKKP